jgi:hypothetical protein
VRLRLGDTDRGAAVQRFALAGLLAHAVFAIAGVLLSVWSFERTPAGIGFDSRGAALWNMTALLWLPAYLALLFGKPRTATAVALAAYLPALVTTVSRLHGDRWAHTPYQIAWLVVGLLPVVALLAGAPEVRVRPWLIGLPVATLLVFAAGLAIQPTGTGLCCAGVVVAAVLARGPVGALTAAMLAAAVGALQVVTVLDFRAFDLAGLAPVGVTAVAGVIAGTRAVISGRRPALA